VFRKSVQNNTGPWKKVLPEVLNYFFENQTNEDLYRFILDGLIVLAKEGNFDLIHSWFEKHKEIGLFEVFFLAIDAREDKQTLQSLSPERRELVLDVMERIKNP
ncbi:MAG: hypothetical protein GY786_02345, partial [Proteobacteria bacterium]|nr:hypothetical protein [Pseudomonadota bacterium]